MEEKDAKVIYSREDDIISLVRAGNKVKFSVDIELPKGDIVLDFGFNGQIIGVEIFNASEFIPVLKEAFNDSEIKAEMNVQYGNDWAEIYYEISIPGKGLTSRSIISPYNKEMILEA